MAELPAYGDKNGRRVRIWIGDIVRSKTKKIAGMLLLIQQAGYIKILVDEGNDFRVDTSRSGFQNLEVLDMKRTSRQEEVFSSLYPHHSQILPVSLTSCLNTYLTTLYPILYKLEGLDLSSACLSQIEHSKGLKV